MHSKKKVKNTKSFKIREINPLQIPDIKVWLLGLLVLAMYFS